MTIRNLSVAVLIALTFPYRVSAIENFEGERGREEPAVVKHAEETESPLLKERTNERKESSHKLRRLEDADVDEITDKDVRAAIVALASQVRHLNERLDRLENSKAGPSAKSGEQAKGPRDVAIKLESLRKQQASKRVMLTYLEGRPERAGRAEGTNAMDRLMTQMKQDLKDIALEIAILELSRD